MSKGYSISIGSETKAFRQGIESGVITPLEDATGTLKDLGESKSLEQLERDLGDAQKATKELGDEIKTTGREISSKSRQAFRDMKDAAKDGTGAASEAVEGFKDEATQNFSQLASSFDGSMESIGDAAQGTLGGLATSIGGPVGLALGGVGAAAGVLFAGIQESAERMTEKVSEHFNRMVQNGGAALDELQKRQLVAEAIDEHWDLILEVADKTGIEASKVAEALAVGGEKAAAIHDKLREIAGADNEFDAHTYRLSGRFNEAAEAAEKAAEKYEVMLDYENRVAEQQGKRLQALADTVSDIPDKKTIEFDYDARQLEAYLGRRHRLTVDVVDRTGRQIL